MNLFQKNNDAPPPYLDRIDEFDHARIVRLKGKIDQNMVPVIQARIEHNRKKQGGPVLDKNIILDFNLVEKIDSAAIAFHILRFEENEKAGQKIGFINVGDDHKNQLEILKQHERFHIYPSEEEALNELNIP